VEFTKLYPRLWLKVLTCKPLLSFPLLVGLFSCAPIEQRDHTQLFREPYFETRLDFQPLEGERRNLALDFEEKWHLERLEPLRKTMKELQGFRAGIFERMEDIVPECGKDPHCVSRFTTVDYQRMEKFSVVNRELVKVQGEIAELQGKIDFLELRWSMRKRAIHNRFLVSEILRAKAQMPRIQNLLVHSLEAYPSRRDLMMRLVQLSHSDWRAKVVGDLDFRHLGEPIDESAVLATFTVELVADEKSKEKAAREYSFTVLVNTFQEDPKGYTEGMLRNWAQRLGEPERETLRWEAYCGLYSLASESFAPRLLDRLRFRFCRDRRREMQRQRKEEFQDRFNPTNWIVPLAYGEKRK
jgi:hypothetical protein